jgi:hypothetical protein
MMLRTLACASALLLAALVALPAGAGEKKAAYSIKVVEAAPPKELKPAFHKLFGTRCVQFYEGGTLTVEVWLHKEVPVKATEAQIKNGLTYREVPSSTVMGALRVTKGLADYRKQRIPPGVYTLRLAQQPMDGDHMGTAPYEDFCLACPAAEDTKAGLMETKAMQELSAKTTDSHPAVLLMFPGMGATEKPRLESKPGGHWVLFTILDAASDGRKAKLPFGLALIGTSPSA